MMNLGQSFTLKIKRELYFSNKVFSRLYANVYLRDWVFCYQVFVLLGFNFLKCFLWKVVGFSIYFFILIMKYSFGVSCLYRSRIFWELFTYIFTVDVSTYIHAWWMQEELVISPQKCNFGISHQRERVIFTSKLMKILFDILILVSYSQAQPTINLEFQKRWTSHCNKLVRFPARRCSILWPV